MDTTTGPADDDLVPLDARPTFPWDDFMRPVDEATGAIAEVVWETIHESASVLEEVMAAIEAILGDIFGEAVVTYQQAEDTIREHLLTGIGGSLVGLDPEIVPSPDPVEIIEIGGTMPMPPPMPHWPVRPLPWLPGRPGTPAMPGPRPDMPTGPTPWPDTPDWIIDLPGRTPDPGPAPDDPSTPPYTPRPGGDLPTDPLPTAPTYPDPDDPAIPDPTLPSLPEIPGVPGLPPPLPSAPTPGGDPSHGHGDPFRSPGGPQRPPGRPQRPTPPRRPSSPGGGLPEVPGPPDDPPIQLDDPYLGGGGTFVPDLPDFPGIPIAPPGMAPEGPTIPGSPIGQPGAPSGPGATPGVPGGASPCPDVHVHIYCSPGSTVEEGDAPASPDLGGGTEYVGIPGEEEEEAPPPLVPPDWFADPTEPEQPGIPMPPYTGAPSTRPRPVRPPRPPISGPPKEDEVLPPPVEEKTPQQEAAERVTWTSLFADPVSSQNCLDWPLADQYLGEIGRSAWKWLAGSGEGGSLDGTSVLGDLKERLPAGTKWVAGLLHSILENGTEWVGALAKVIGGCDRPSFVALQGLRSLLGFVEEWVGASFPESRTKVDYLIGQLCAVELPSLTEVDQLYRTGRIDIDKWTCWVRSLGQNDKQRENLLFLGQPMPTPAEIVRLTRIFDEPDSDIGRRIKHTGVYTEEVENWYVQLSKYIPPTSDLITMMVRDVFDDSVVAKYQYDSEYEQKFSGLAKYWARINGITDEQMKYYWRAHWQLPSPTQAYTMLHRLRPGRVDAGVVTERDDVAKLLEIADIPPYWRDRLVAISYHTLTRVDARRAYFIGSLSEQETLDAVLDMGYDDKNARLLMRYWKTERVKWLAGQPWARAYARGELTDTEMVAEVSALNMGANEQDALEGELERRQGWNIRKDVAKAMKSRVVKGLMDDDDARRELVAAGYRPARADALVRGWAALRAARGRQASASQLCKMHGRGFIDAGEYATALMRHGYEPEWIAHIMALCSAEQKDKKTKESDSDAAKAARAAQAGAAARLREARQAQAAHARAARAQAARTRQEEATMRRLGDAMRRLASRYGGMPSDYTDVVQRWHVELTLGKGYSRTGAADMVLELAGSLGPARDGDWEARGDAVIASMPSVRSEEDEAPGEPPEGLPDPTEEEGGETK